MPRRAFNEIAKGFVPDLPAWDMDPGFWSDSRNVHYRDGAVEKFRGQTAMFGSASASDIIYIAPISDGVNQFWAYAQDGQVWATDGSTHSNISSGSYSAGLDLGWNGGPLNGFLILNDGVTAPYSWDPGLGNTMTALVNWPASTTAQVIRIFRNFIFAFRITESGDFNPRLVRWSTSANTGLPSSWDYTDPANDSGRTELGETEDIIVDALQIRDQLAIYKQRHTWLGQFIGGRDVMAFRKLFSEVGILTENCVTAFGDRHLVLGTGDVIIHDGHTPKSILDGKARSWLFNKIDADNYRKCFTVLDYRNREIWICFPESGETYPNLALVWNYFYDTLQPRELGTNMAFGAEGIVSTTGGSTDWDSDTATWDADTTSWDESFQDPTKLSVVLAPITVAQLLQADQGEDFAGTAMAVYFLRENLALTKDIRRIKRVMRVYPKILGTIGDTIDIYVGTRDALDAAVSFSGPFPFTIGTDDHINCRVSGRIIDLRFNYNNAQTFRVFGYDVEFENEGYR